MLQSLVKLLCLVSVWWLVSTIPVRADEFCRQLDSHRVCILRIERSAKNYWQYQAVVSTDGIEQPFANYDCRERLITEPDGNMAAFRTRPAGAFVCSLYRR